MKSLTRWILVCVLSFLILVFAPYPFLWLFGLGAAICGRVAVYISRRVLKILFLNFSLILLTLFVVDLAALLWESFGPEPQKQRRYSRPQRMASPHLGYAPRPNASYRVTMKYGEQLAYVAEYNFDEFGLRVTPAPEHLDSPVVVFFGCSNTLGEGVQDEEAFPYLVGQATGWRSLNFGFHGYGPHQMLGALQNGLVERVTDRAPDYVVYTAIRSHPLRCAGLAPWDDTGPYYRLDDVDGSVVRHGSFAEADFAFRVRRLLFRRMNDSFVGRHLLFEPESRVDLWAAIVNEARLEVKRRWPDAEFRVVHLGEGPEVVPQKKRLAELEVPTFWPKEDMPELRDKVLKHDGHPSAEAHRMLADYIVDKLLCDKP